MPQPGTAQGNRFLTELLFTWCHALYTRTIPDLPIFDLISYHQGDTMPFMALVHDNKNHILYILARGIYTFTDVKIACMIATVQITGGMRSHRGFKQVADHCLLPIRAHIQQLDPQQIILCGHSMGGAVLTLVASVLHEEDGQKVEVLCLGTPPFIYHHANLFTNPFPFPVHIRMHDEDYVSNLHHPWARHAGEIQVTQHLAPCSPHYLQAYCVSAYFDEKRIGNVVEPLSVVTEVTDFKASSSSSVSNYLFIIFEFLLSFFQRKK